MTKIPAGVMNAPVEGRALICLHEAALIAEGVWRGYYDRPEPKILPLAQRVGDRVWITTDTKGNGREISVSDLPALCRC